MALTHLNNDPGPGVPAVLTLACLLALVLAGCAGQVAPSGGPPDTIPPKIVTTDPDTNAIRVTQRTITLEFSEYVDRRSVQDAIFISPSLGELEYDWSGQEVTIRFEDSLRHNTTYVVSVGTDVRDLRAGNRMASAFTLAFSTGDSIDRGSVSGKVFGEKPEGVMIFAYRLDDVRVDTLNPSHTEPYYMTQTGKNGSFSLVHMRLGRYRLFAVNDEYRNLLYDRQVDQFGVLRGDLQLTASDTSLSKYWFRMSREDTARPFLASAKALDSRRILLRLSEPVDSASVMHSSIQITDTVKGNPVRPVASFIDPEHPTSLVIYTAAPLDSPAVYRVRLAGLADTVGNVLDDQAGVGVFEGIAAPDTVKRTAQVQGLRDSTKGVAVDYRPEVLFSVPVEGSGLVSRCSLLDSLGRPVWSEIVRRSPVSIQLLPRVEFRSRSWYTLRIRLDSLKDILGKSYPDTTVTLRFQTVDLRSMGSLSGVVVDENPDSGNVVITATRIDPAPRTSVRQSLPRPGPFAFDRLPEGKYTLEGFRDTDGSGKYSAGRPFPFLASERFTASTDTIRVRARWKVEGATLRFTGR
jgi:hypothetical protein